MPPSSSTTTAVDERGFIFKLPHLGLPDPTGEWVLVKSAIGTKEAALEKLVHDKTLVAPLRQKDKNAGLTAFDFQGALWALPLLTPAPSPTAPPEFFTLKVRRMFSDAMEFPRSKLPDDFDWIFYPISVYKQVEKEEKSSSSAKDEQDDLGGFLFEGGKASDTKDAVKRSKKKKKKQQSNPDKEISEWEFLMMDIFNEEWWESVTLQAMLEKVKLGDQSAMNAADFDIRLGIQPSPDDDYRHIQYAVCPKDEPSDAKLPAERWKTLPPEATKSGAQRRFVNICREGKKHKPFTKEEWDEMQKAQS